MNQRQAWRFLAKEWERLLATGEHNEFTDHGFCRATHTLRMQGLISKDVEDAMDMTTRRLLMENLDGRWMFGPAWLSDWPKRMRREAAANRVILATFFSLGACDDA